MKNNNDTITTLSIIFPHSPRIGVGLSFVVDGVKGVSELPGGALV